MSLNDYITFFVTKFSLRKTQEPLNVEDYRMGLLYGCKRIMYTLLISQEDKNDCDKNSFPEKNMGEYWEKLAQNSCLVTLYKCRK